MKKPTIQLIELSGCSIYEQLQIEEALLRASRSNYCLLNSGSSLAIVMGISGKAEELLDIEAVSRDRVPLLRRFSGGGTVVVDSDTLFASFIVEEEAVGVLPLPDKVHCWMKQFYSKVFYDLPHFSLHENDYTFGDRKFGGNAQYLRKERWLHHTSFLWDYSPENMRYLQIPKKAPLYRMGRCHDNFLCKLKQFLPRKEAFVERVINQLKENFKIELGSSEEIAAAMAAPHRKATQLLDSVQKKDTAVRV